MATFRKRGKKWEYRIRYTDDTGQKKELSKGGFATKPEAEYEAAIAYTDLKDGKASKNDNITVSEYINEWFEIYKATVKPTSWRSREINAKRIKKEIGTARLKSITTKRLQKLLNDLSKDYARNTLLSIRDILAMVFQQATIDGYFKLSPVSDIKIPHYTTEDKIVFWQPSEIKLFQEFCAKEINMKRKKEYQHVAIEKERELAMYYLMLYGGLRIGECCALYMSDYDSENKTVSISKTLGSRAVVQNKDTYEVLPPKTKSSNRVIPLPEIAYKQLEKWLFLRKEYHLRFANIFIESEFIFVKRDGAPLSPRDLRTKFNVLVKKLDITQISPHGLRHTYTSLLIQSDTNVKQIQLLLGHGSIKTTLDIYAHISDDSQKEAISKFDDMLKKMS